MTKLLRQRTVKRLPEIRKGVGQEEEGVPIKGRHEGPLWGWKCSAPIDILVVIWYYSLFLFLFFWLCWVFVAVHGLSLVAASGGYFSLCCAGLLRWLLLLRSMGSRHAGFSSCGSWALEHRLSSCGARA